MSHLSTIDAVTTSLISPHISDHSLTPSIPIKLGIMASGNGSNFEVIAQAIHTGQINAQIQVLIYNNPTAIVAERAANWGVKSVLLNHRHYQNREEFDSQIVQLLQHHDVELVVMAGWMRLVTKIFIDAFPEQIINIHPSLLPSFKGINAVEQALASGVKITGCTVHIACLEMDSGRNFNPSRSPCITKRHIRNSPRQNSNSGTSDFTTRDCPSFPKTRKNSKFKIQNSKLKRL